MAVYRVLAEPRLAVQFPANREINREFPNFAIDFMHIDSCNYRIPLSLISVGVKTEQGT